MLLAFLWLTSHLAHSMIFCRSVHVAANGVLSFFLWLSSCPLCICTTSSLSIQLPQTFRLLLRFSCCKQCCYKYQDACILFKLDFSSFPDKHPGLGSYYFKNVKKPPSCSTQWLHQHRFILHCRKLILYSLCLSVTHTDSQ